MNIVTNFIEKSVSSIVQKSTLALEQLRKQLLTSQKQIFQVTQAEQCISTELKQPQESLGSQKSIRNEKVLEIDVVQSGYISKEYENLQQIRDNLQPIHESREVEAKDNKQLKQSRSPSHLLQIQNQKKNIIEELKKLDQQIASIKGEVIDDATRKRKQKNLEQEEFRRHAKQLVRNLKNQKKEAEQRKRRQAEKQLLLLKQQEEQRRQRRQQEITRLKQQKRRVIEARLEADRQKREQRKLIQKQSNKLLVQLKKEQDFIKQKDMLPAEFRELQEKKTIEKRPEVNFREIEQHERRYMFIREQERQQKRDHSTSINKPVAKYQKNTWTEKIEEEVLKRKEQDKIKQMQRKQQLQKRLKYGQLVKNIFLPKRKDEPKLTQLQLTEKSNDTHSLLPLQLPKISENDKRITESKAMKKFTENQRALATAHNYKNPHKQVLQVKQETIQDVENQRMRKIRQQELRKQTKQRLKKLENRSLDPLPKSKPKYENYLGQVGIKKKDDAESWQRIFDDNKLSKQQKYKEMLKKASAMQTKAKMKEELRKHGDEDALNLYIGSIQAKLALLQKF